jgi:hypothetical protein
MFKTEDFNFLLVCLAVLWLNEVEMKASSNQLKKPLRFAFEFTKNY